MDSNVAFFEDLLTRPYQATFPHDVCTNISYQHFLNLFTKHLMGSHCVSGVAQAFEKMLQGLGIRALEILS